MWVVLKDIGSSIGEIAILGVLDKFQGRGFGKKLFESGLKKLEGKQIYCVSRNPIVIKMMKENGFVSSFNALALPWQVSLDNFVYILNFGRLKEAFRKHFTYKNQPPFYYGIKK